MEMNLSETAFVLKEKDEDGKDKGTYSLRWFTPGAEVDLCGHATLASGHIMWQEGVCSEDETIKFNTRSGLLTAKKSVKGITLDFPAIPQKEIKYPPELITAIGGAKPVYVGMTKWNYILELENEAAVINAKPDYTTMLSLPGWGTIITAQSDKNGLGKEGYDVVSRFFAPEKGIPEDPVTGSAHCAIAPYWQNKLGRNTLKAYQASERGGTLYLEVIGDRVTLTGTGVTMMVGEMEIPD
jgi:PhzF family phenazine biosynthesis protein